MFSQQDNIFFDFQCNSNAFNHDGPPDNKMHTFNIIVLFFTVFSACGYAWPEYCYCGYDTLICSGQDIITFPDVQHDASWISAIEIRHADIPSLQSGQIVIQFIPGLAYLFRDNNQIWAVEESLVGNNSQIKYLSLNNNLSRIPTELLQITRNLETLYLDNNQLVSLPPFAFNRNRKLVALSMRHNTIHTIESNALTGLHHLNYLHLSNNALMNFPFEELQSGSLSNLTSFTLDENSLVKIVTENCSSVSLVVHISVSFNNFKLYCLHRN